MYFNEEEFKKYLIDKCIFNLRFIKSIKFNKNSITIKCEDKNLVNEKTLYNLIIDYLISYINFNKIEFPTDKDFLTYKFKKLNVR